MRAFAAVLFLSLSLTPAVHAMGAVTATPAADGTTEQGGQLAKDGKYKDAIALLTAIVEKTPQDANAHNWLGYSYRKLKDMAMAATHYRAALSLKPDHKGALNYYGELFVEQGDAASARDMLNRLTLLCPAGCIERDELAASLAKLTKS